MKRIGLLLLFVCLVVALTACKAGSAPIPSPSPSMLPSAYPQVSPGLEGTPGIGVTPGIGASPVPNDRAMLTAAMTGPESSALSKKANDAAAKISEVDSCVTAIIGDTCVAGVTFDKQYKGELTDRIRDMVASRIQSVVPTVERVAVTNDPEIAAQIGAVAEKISKTDSLGDLAGELDAVIGRIN